MDCNEKIPTPLLEKFSDWITQEIGLYFPEKTWDILLHKIKMASIECGFPSVEKYIFHHLSSPKTLEKIQKLSEYLTIGETYFFRDPESFQILQTKLLPQILKKHEHDKQLRIWSAGCCTGEEPYSIAIALEQILKPCDSWTIHILATDINGHFLQTAEKGIYRNWSFRNAHPWLQSNYFHQQEEGVFKIHSRFKKQIQFLPLNLIQHDFSSLLPSGAFFDIIFCRNVLMYFSLEQRNHVVKKFKEVLCEEGWLLLSSTELSTAFNAFLTPVKFAETIFYQNTSRPSELAPSFVFEPAVFPTINEEKKEFYEDLLEPLSPPLIQATCIRPTFPKRIVSQTDLEKVQQLANQGALDESLQLCEQTLKGDPLHFDFLLLKATLFEAKGDWEKAVQTLKQILYLRPEFPLIYFRLGVLTWKQGNTKKAEHFFQQALRLLNRLRPEELVLGSEQLTAKDLIQSIYSRKSLKG